MTENEMKLTLKMELQILRDSIQWGSNVEKMRYYVQFGCCAPSWPEPSRRARRWLRQLDRL